MSDVNPLPEEKNEETLSEADQAQVSAGLNPQPLPPDKIPVF
jgi:hypothetical protein